MVLSLASMSSPGAESQSVTPATNDSLLCEMVCLLADRLLQRWTAVPFPLKEHSLRARVMQLNVCLEIRQWIHTFIILALVVFGLNKGQWNSEIDLEARLQQCLFKLRGRERWTEPVLKLVSFFFFLIITLYIYIYTYRSHTYLHSVPWNKNGIVQLQLYWLLMYLILDFKISKPLTFRSPPKKSAVEELPHDTI